MDITVTKTTFRTETGIRVTFRSNTHHFDYAEAWIDWGFGRDKPNVEVSQGSIGGMDVDKARLRMRMLELACLQAEELAAKYGDIDTKTFRLEVTRENHNVEREFDLTIESFEVGVA